MSWLNDLVHKKFQNSGQDIKDIPNDMWTKCPSCSSILFKKDIEENMYTCSVCNYYFNMPVSKRLASIFNDGKFKTYKVENIVEDPIDFKGKDKYSEKIAKYRKNSEYEDAAVVAYGKIGNKYAICFAMDFNFMGGSMGSYVGEAFTVAVAEAVKQNLPLIAITASGGARMQEGIFSLMQMAKTTIGVETLKKHNLPYIVFLTNPTTGGVTASYAMLGDIHMAEKSALIGFAGARVIEKTIRKTLPEGFQSAEYLLDHGMVDLIVTRLEAREKLSTILDIVCTK